jgi:hypothetical protein
MSDHNSVPTQRLLAATLATHEAFAIAARAVSTAGFAAEFAQRAEYQERIASHLRGSHAPLGLASDKLRRVPDVAVVLHGRRRWATGAPEEKLWLSTAPETSTLLLR